MKTSNRTSGQATTELVIILPLFMILAAAAISVTYMCWQGIKVQQAANFAARIQGQERVSGAYAPLTGNAGIGVSNINQDNGTDVVGDQVPDMNGVAQGSFQGPRGATLGVYGKYYQLVKGMFNPGEQAKLFIPKPIEGINSDAVEVVRIMVPPKMFGFQMKPIKVDAVAYGGEDPHAYGLPRWGRTTQAAGSKFFPTAINNPGND